jgi:hypothetical protein
MTRGQRRRAERRAGITRARGQGAGEMTDMFTGDYQRGARSAEHAGGLMQDQYDQFGAMARGQGPSLAQQQLAASTQQTIGDQMGMQASSRGGNLAAQARAAGGMGAAAQMAGSQQAAALRSQEQMQAMGAQTGIAGAMQQAAIQQQLGVGGMAMQHQLGTRGLDQQHMTNMRGMFSPGGSGGGGGGAIGGIIGAVSDERAKKNVGAGGLAATQAVGELEPKTFEYRPGFGEPGQRVGIMAQALERTPAGQALVHDTPLGKTVDVGGLAALNTAATAEMLPRLEQIEKRMGLAGAKR